ncbi:MAG: response regulator transcription factor [Agriterribacter sp.]
MRTLIIEDERSMALEIEDFLKKSGYSCELAFSGKQAQVLMEDASFDFILLDLGLPDKDGLVVLEEAKRCCPSASYIIITARGKVEDKIKGLDLGADDYLAKPFSLLELQSRLHAITRRKSGLKESIIELGDFKLFLTQRIAKQGEQEVELSKKEFDLLCYMALHKNRPLTRLQLSEHIWGNLSDDDYDSNFIDVHIKNIRKKMNEYSETDWLQTIRGVGYKIKI